MDPEKVQAVQNWQTPQCIKDVLSFLGFANFYRKFIYGYGNIIIPLTDFTRNDVPFIWTTKKQETFETLKRKITDKPVLLTFDFIKPVEIETDVSDFAIGRQLG